MKMNDLEFRRIEDISAWSWWILLNSADSAVLLIFYCSMSRELLLWPLYYFLKEHDEVFQMDIDKLIEL